MPKKSDLSNQRFGRLVVTGQAPNLGKETRWFCVCDCGTKTIAQSNNLRSGNTTSCGCMARLRHGHSKVGKRHPLYGRWAAMIQRCTNPNHRQFGRYGGRGITVCDEWRTSFVAFLNDVGSPPGPRYSLDRIDNDKGYEPGNVRWATQSQQCLNRSEYKHAQETRLKISKALKESHQRSPRQMKRDTSGKYVKVS